MYCILSQNPIKDFFQATNKTEYAYNSNYFSIKPYIKKKDIYDNLYAWVDWYTVFDNKPLFLTVMTDKYWFRNVDESESIRRSILFVNWGNIPSNILEMKDRKYKSPLQEKARLWNDSDYFKSMCEVILKNNFNENEIVEIKLGGKTNELYRMG